MQLDTLRGSLSSPILAPEPVEMNTYIVTGQQAESTDATSLPMPSIRRLAVTIAATLTAIALATGCESVRPRAALTQEQAATRVATRAQEALQHLPPGASPRVDRNAPELPCDDKPGSTFVETRYVIDYPPGWPFYQVLPYLATYWTNEGYQKVRDDRNDPEQPAFAFEDPDGFRISIELYHRDNSRYDAYLLSSSPCL